MRSFDYLRDKLEINDLIRLVREYKSIVEQYDYAVFLPEEQTKIKEFSGKVNEFLEKYDQKWPNDLSSRINKDLISPEVVNKLETTHGEYPHDASPLGCEVEIKAKELFTLEEEIAKYVARIWKSSLTSFEDFENGKPFSIVATATENPEQFPGGPGFSRRWSQFTSSSLFTNHMIESFLDIKLLLVCDVDDSSLLGTSEVDTATHETLLPGIKTIAQIDGKNYIQAGYSGSGYICTKLLTPSMLEERRIRLNREKGEAICEVVLDKKKTKYTGILLLSDGYDVLMNEYLAAIQARRSMGLQMKCLNKALYRQGPPLKENLDQLSERIQDALDLYEYNYGFDFTRAALEGYIQDVVLPMNYSEEIVNLYQSKLSSYHRRTEAELIEVNKR